MDTRTFARCLGILTVIGLLAACGGGSSAPSAVTEVISAAGGTVTGPDGVQVVIPAGALDQSTTIGIARSSAGAPATLPEDYTSTRPVYEFTPHDLVFNVPVTIRMPASDGTPSTEILMASPGGDWQLYDATLSGGFAEWQRNSFSWGMVGLACAPSNSAPYSASNPDPYPCSLPRGFATASATPASAMARRTFGSSGTFSGSAGSWDVSQASSVRLTINYQAAPDCQNPRAKLLRWNPAVPQGTPGRVQTLFDGPVTLTPTPVSPPPGTPSTGGGPTFRGVGSASHDVSFSHLDNGTSAFGYSFSCNRPFRTTQSGGDVLTFVSAIPVPSVSYAIGGTVSGLTGTGLVLRNNGGDNRAVTANGAFTFATAIGGGAPYSVTVFTQPSGQTCSVQNGSGTANSNVTNVAVSCVAAPVMPRFAYVANSGSNNISAYSINVSTGALTSVGPAVMAGTTPYSVTVDPLGKFAFVANNISNDVSAYTIDASTGGLTSVGAPVAAGTNPYSITVDPSGKFAYVVNFGSANVSTYSIHPTTGALTGGGTAASGAQPLFVAVHPTGKFAYVAANGGVLRTYTINATTGALTMVSDVVPGFSLRSVTVDPTGKFAYAAVAHVGVMAYTIDPATGSLTAIAGNPVTAGTFPISVAVDSTGKFAYVANFDSNNVSIFTIDATTGALTPVGNVAAGTQPHFVTVDPSGKFAYTANFGSNNVSAYSINASTGALTSVGAAVAAGSNPTSVTTARQ